MTQEKPPFLIDEGSLAIPAGFQDRTSNIFIHGVAESSILNLNIGRDNYADDETLELYVSRQIKLLTEKLPGYKLKSRNPAQLGVAALAGEQIDGGYKNGGRFLHQRQAAFPISATRVLIFSATSVSPFDAQFETVWAQWLASFVARGQAQG